MPCELLLYVYPLILVICYLLTFYFIVINLWQINSIQFNSVGSNDINPNNYDKVNVKQLSDDIIDIGKKCLKFGVKDIIISSVLTKRNIRLTKVICQLNDCLRDACNANKFKYLCNNNILYTHIWDDGIHLTDAGIYMLAGNFVDLLNNFIFANYV